MFIHLTAQAIANVNSSEQAATTELTEAEGVLQETLIGLKTQTTAENYTALCGFLGRLESIYLLNPFDAPGLFFAAGQILLPDAAGDPSLINTTGVAKTAYDALASLLGETAEVIAERSSLLPPPEMIPKQDLLKVWTADPYQIFLKVQDAKLDILACVKATHLGGKQSISAPVSFLNIGSPHGPAAAFRSQGFGAGPTLNHARLHAIWELIERDATQRWWSLGQSANALHFDGAAEQEIQSFISDLRQGARGRLHHFLKLHSPTGFPVVAAVSYDQRGHSYACGIAARADTVSAAKSAIVEMCQMEFGATLIREKANKLGKTQLSEEEITQLTQLDDVNAKTFGPFNPDTKTTVKTNAKLDLSLCEMIEELRHKRIEIYSVSMMKERIGLGVVKCLSPQLLPSLAHVSDPEPITSVEKTPARGHNGAGRPLI